MSEMKTTPTFYSIYFGIYGTTIDDRSSTAYLDRERERERERERDTECNSINTVLSNRSSYFVTYRGLAFQKQRHLISGESRLLLLYLSAMRSVVGLIVKVTPRLIASSRIESDRSTKTKDPVFRAKRKEQVGRSLQAFADPFENPSRDGHPRQMRENKVLRIFEKPAEYYRRSH